MKTTPTKTIPEYEKGLLPTSGINFEIGLHTLFALSGIQHFKNSDWRLSSKNQLAGTFDDLIFESDQGDILLQAKLNHKKKLSHVHFLSDNSCKAQFSLAKYILSFKATKSFNIKYLILCINSDVPLSLFNRIENETISKIFGDSSIYTINTKNITKIEQNVRKFKNMKNDTKGQGHSEQLDVTKEDIELFISKFMCVKISEKQIQIQIQQKLTSPLYNFSLATVEYLLDRVRDWYNIESDKAVYLTNLHIKLFLYGEESRNNIKHVLSNPLSFKHLSKFESYNIVFFKTDQKPNWYLGRVLTTLKHMYKNDSEDTFYNEVLFIDEDKDFTILNDVLECFELATVNYLVISFTNLTEAQIHLTYKKINKICKDYNKKAFIVGGYLVLDDYTNVKIIREQISFELLDDPSQCDILNKCLNVQGYRVKLKDAISRTKKCLFLTVLDVSVITRLSEEEQYIIGRCIKIKDITESDYIDRTLRSESNVFSEQKLLKNIKTPFVILSGPPGAGKTTLLRKLSTIIKEENPLTFVVNLNLIEAAEQLERRSSNSTLLDQLCIIENVKTAFEIEVFRSLQKIILIDDINEDSRKLIEELQELVRDPNCNISMVIIATSNYEIILKSLRTFQVVTLEPLTEKNKLDMFKQLRFRFTDISYVMLVETLFKNLTIGAPEINNICLTPLEVEILMEIIIANMDMNLLVDMFSKKISIYRFHEYFMESRKHLFVRKESNSKMKNWRILSETFDGYIKKMKLLAAKRMCSSNLLSQCITDNDIDLDASVLQVGVMKMNNNKFSFTHKIFEEYFAAEYIWENLLYNNKNSDLLLGILKEVFMNTQLFGVSDFIESILETTKMRERETIEAISKIYGSLLHKMEWNEHNNIIHMTFRGQINIIKLLLEHYEHCHAIINIRGFFNETALHLSAYHPHLLKYFVEKGADINFSDENGCKVSHYVLMMCWDSEIYTKYFNNNLKNMKECNHVNRNKFLEDYESKDKSLESLRYLRTIGVDLNAENNNGDTLLHLAAYGNTVNVLQYLIEDCRFDLHIVNYSGNTPLHYAAESGSLEALKYLHLKGSNLNDINVNGDSVVHKAALGNATNVLKYIIEECNINSSILNHFGKTPLDFARDRNAFDALNYLTIKKLGSNTSKC